MRPDTVPPDLVLHLKTNQCGVKNCRVSIPQWDVNPPFPWGNNLSATTTSRGPPQVKQLEVPRPPAGVDPDGRVYQAGIKTVRPVRPKETCSVGLHRHLYQSTVDSQPVAPWCPVN
jgi:hypothetical protein